MELNESSAKVLQVFLDAPREEQYGFGLIRATGVSSGQMYPTLESLEQRSHWIESYEEPIDEQSHGRPKRRLYRLTPLGDREGRKALALFSRELLSREIGTRPAWVPGFKGV